MAISIAKLDTVDLPDQFSYRPASPQKRLSIAKTVGAVVIQRAAAIVPGDSLMRWRCEACCVSDWEWFFDKFNQAAHPSMPFVGYWGDSFQVKFHALDDPRVRARLFDLSGSFQIVSVTAWHSP